MFVGGAPALHPVGDVAGLALGILGPAAVIDAGADAAAQGEEGGFLGDPRCRVGGVAEDENVEMRQQAELAQLAMDDFERGHDTGGGFVVGRHQESSARGQRRRAAGCPGGAGAAGEERDEAADAADQGKSDPGEQRHEQRDHQPGERRHAVDAKDQDHFAGGGGGEQQRAAHDQQAPQCDPGWRGGGARGAGGAGAQGLHRHGEPGLVRQGGGGWASAQAVHR